MSSDRAPYRGPIVTDPRAAERLAADAVNSGAHRAAPVPDQVTDGEPGSIFIPASVMNGSHKARRAYVTVVLRAEPETELDMTRRCRDARAVGSQSECRHCGLSVLDHPADLVHPHLRVTCWRERVLAVTVRHKK